MRDSDRIDEGAAKGRMAQELQRGPTGARVRDIFVLPVLWGGERLGVSNSWEAGETMAFVFEAMRPGVEREHRFHQTRKWRFDFAWPDIKVALEVEGGTWAGGRHTRGKGYEGDCEKYSEAAILGWCVVRATTNMCQDGRAFDLVERAIGARS